jgi:hypothetical protein
MIEVFRPMRRWLERLVAIGALVLGSDVTRPGGPEQGWFTFTVAAVIGLLILLRSFRKVEVSAGLVRIHNPRSHIIRVGQATSVDVARTGVERVVVVRLSGPPHAVELLGTVASDRRRLEVEEFASVVADALGLPSGDRT